MTSKQRLIANLKFIEECTHKDPNYLDSGLCRVIETSLMYDWNETVFKVLGLSVSNIAYWMLPLDSSGNYQLPMYSSQFYTYHPTSGGDCYDYFLNPSTLLSARLKLIRDCIELLESENEN